MCERAGEAALSLDRASPVLLTMKRESNWENEGLSATRSDPPSSSSGGKVKELKRHRRRGEERTRVPMERAKRGEREGVNWRGEGGRERTGGSSFF